MIVVAVTGYLIQSSVDGVSWEITNGERVASITTSTPTPSGDGYLMSATDGGVFTFSNRDFIGSATTIT